MAKNAFLSEVKIWNDATVHNQFSAFYHNVPLRIFDDDLTENHRGERVKWLLLWFNGLEPRPSTNYIITIRVYILPRNKFEAGRGRRINRCRRTVVFTNTCSAWWCCRKIVEGRFSKYYSSSNMIVYRVRNFLFLNLLLVS